MPLTNPIFNVVRPFVEQFLSEQSEAQFRKKLERAAPSILKRMAKDNPRSKGARHAIRYCLYWLWKSVVKSGEIADLARDHSDDAVLAVVLPALSTDADDAAVLKATTDELVRLVF